MSNPTLLVFSHLRWSFVFQRPQHLLSRLSDRWNILFVEEPVHTAGEAFLERREVDEGLTVLVPHTPVAAPGFDDAQHPVIQRLLENHLATHRLAVDVAWVYTPLAQPMVKPLRPVCTVYDCMDELSAFKNAPAQLRQREAALMRAAQLVLTGGPSLYEARRHQHPQVVCLPSAVDSAHYAPGGLDAASPAALEAERLQGHLVGPRLGFFGVIDERLDIRLVDRLAAAHPEWSVVMAGPVVKIDPADLPRRENIHWLGMQPYGRLPYLLAGWDVALMPFALNESTRFISPTKTLEYMAGERPVVSTPVRDVVSLYGDAVEVAEAGDAFVRACERVLAESPSERCTRAIAMLTSVAQHSWDRSADSVHLLMAEALMQARSRSAERRVSARSMRESETTANQAAAKAAAWPAAANAPASAGAWRS